MNPKNEISINCKHGKFRCSQNAMNQQKSTVELGHIVTGDLNIVRNDKLQDSLRKGPKYKEPVSFPWHRNFDSIMDACEAYSRRWAKKEDIELDSLSERIKSIGDVLKGRIRRLKHPVNTNTSPFLVTLMLSQSFPVSMRTLPAGKKRLASQFNFTYRYIDDVLSINSPDFENYLGQMYPPELEIKDTTESNTSLYDKRDDFNFHITNFPLPTWICSCQSVGMVNFILPFTTNDDHIQWHPPLIGHYTNFWPLLI